MIGILIAMTKRRTRLPNNEFRDWQDAETETGDRVCNWPGCEGIGDCMDSDTADCDAQPLLPAPDVTCGPCRFMQGCAGTTAGTCVDYPAGTDTGTCGE